MLLGISRYIDPHLQCVVRIPTLGANCAPKMGHPVAEDGCPIAEEGVSDCRRGDVRFQEFFGNGLPISQWWPKGSTIRPMRQPYSFVTGQTRMAPAAIARS